MSKQYRFESEYDTMSFFANGFEVGSEALFCGDGEEVLCVVSSVTRRSSFDSFEAYDAATDKVFYTSSAFATAEFIEDNDCYYVELERAS